MRSYYNFSGYTRGAVPHVKATCRLCAEQARRGNLSLGPANDRDVPREEMELAEAIANLHDVEPGVDMLAWVWTLDRNCR